MLAAGLASVQPLACSTENPTDTGGGEPIDATGEELSDPVAEKLIPLRFVNLLDAPGSPDNATYQGILRAIDAANEVFRAAGIQFWLRSIERYHST